MSRQSLWGSSWFRWGSGVNGGTNTWGSRGISGGFITGEILFEQSRGLKAGEGWYNRRECDAGI